MKLKRVAGIVALVIGMVIFILAGNGPLEGPVGLAIGVLFGSLFSIAGGILIGKSVLDQGE